MAITLHASVIVDGRMQHLSHALDAAGLDTLRAVFERVDRDRLMGRKFFHRLLKRHRKLALTLLHNGRRLDLPAGLDEVVTDGDEVTFLTPTMGG